MGKRINMVRPDGTTVSVPAAKKNDFLFLGYRDEGGHEAIERLTIEAEKEYYTSPGQQVVTGIEGTVSGLTLGIADILMDDNATRKRAAYNDEIRLGTELFGGVVPALFTGGESYLAKILMKTPTGALTKASTRLAGGGTRGMIAGGAIEGVVAGAGGELTRSALSGDPLTVEGVAAGAGLGFVFGTGAGALGAGLTKLGSGFRGKSIEQDFVDTMLHSGTPAQTGGAFADVAPLGRAEFRPVNLHPNAESALDAQESVSRGLIPDERFQELRATVKGFKTEAAKLEAQVKDASAALKSHVVQLEKMGDDLYAKALAAPRRNVGEEIAGHIPNKGAKSSGHMVSDKGHLSSKPHEPGGVDLERRTMAQDVRELRGALRSALSGGSPGQAQKAAERYRQAIARLASSFGGEVPPVLTQQAISSVDAVVDFHQAVQKLNMPHDAESFFGLGAGRAEELFARLDAVLKSGVPEARPLQEQLAQVVDQLTESSGVVAKDGNAVSKLRSVWAAGHEAREQAGKGWEAAKFYKPGVSDAVDADIGKAVDEANRLGTKAPGATQKSKSAPKSAIKGQLERAAMQAAIQGMTGKRAAWLLATMVSAKAAVMDRIAAAVTRFGEPLGKGARSVGPRLEPLLRSYKGHQDPEGDLQAAFKNRSEELRELMVTGRDRAFLTAQELSALGHGEFAKAMYDHSYAPIDALMMRMPKDPPGTSWGTEYIWETPPEQLAVFSQEWEAGTAPVDFIERALSDPQSVYPSAVEVLAESWPMLYAEVRTRLLDQLARTGTKQYDHGDLVGLSVFTATPLVPTMDAGFIQDHAAMLFTPPPQPKPSSPQGTAGRPPGMNPDATKAQALGAR